MLTWFKLDWNFRKAFACRNSILYRAQSGETAVNGEAQNIFCINKLLLYSYLYL